MSQVWVATFKFLHEFLRTCSHSTKSFNLNPYQLVTPLNKMIIYTFVDEVKWKAKVEKGAIDQN
jgi:hypothetical protein